MGVILTDIKQLLGIGPDDKSFDLEITMHINSVITILTQLGVGPEEGFVIESATPWTEFIGTRKDLEIVRSFIYLKVRLLFDPPQNSFLVTSIVDQAKEYAWRIEVQVPPVVEEIIIDESDEFYEDDLYIE